MAGSSASSLATFSLTRGKADEGDAVLVNSGAALGLGFGALAEFFYAGDIENRTPYTGAGYGTAIGLVAGGTLATFVQVSPSRVLLIDLGAGLGAAAGAAAGSPLVFEDVTQDKTRGFVAATAGGMLARRLDRVVPHARAARDGSRSIEPAGAARHAVRRRRRKLGDTRRQRARLRRRRARHLVTAARATCRSC